MKNKKKRLTSNVSIGGPAPDANGLRIVAEKDPKAFATKCRELIDGGMRWSDVKSLPRLFDALADVQVPVTVSPGSGLRERAVMASAFPLLSGGFTEAGINDAFDAVETIGEQLVTDIEDNKKTTQIVSITSEDVQIDRVDEGKDFPLVGAGEERFEIRSKRNGRRIAITAEMIEENDVNGIVQRVDALGQIAADFVEEQTIRRVCDIDGSGTSPAEPYVLRPNGAGVALYQTDNDPLTRLPSAGNRVTNNALVDTTDLDAVRLRLAGMTNSRGKRIPHPASRSSILVPDALLGVALKIRGSEREPSVENELNNWGPAGRFQPAVISSPLLDDLSTSAWYYGEFKKQFIRKWKLRMEYITLQGDIQAFLLSRIAYQSRIAWDVEIGAGDYVHVIQSLSGTTAP